jgi:hypothetical protein
LHLPILKSCQIAIFEPLSAEAIIAESPVSAITSRFSGLSAPNKFLAVTGHTGNNDKAKVGENRRLFCDSLFGRSDNE